jgi:hypothetical protein
MRWQSCAHPPCEAVSSATFGTTVFSAVSIGMVIFDVFEWYPSCCPILLLNKQSLTLCCFVLRWLCVGNVCVRSVVGCASKGSLAINLGNDLRKHVLDHCVSMQCLKESVLEFYLILPGVQYGNFMSLTKRFTLVSASPLGNAGIPRVPILCKQMFLI